MDGNGSPFGGLISSKVIEEKIDNVNYILKLKTNLFFIVFYIFLFILLFNIIIIYDIQIIKPSNENIQCIKNISKENYLFISLIVTSGIILFIFHFWLSFPGYFQFTDIFTSMLEAFHNNNEGPVFDFHLDRWTPNNPDASYPRLTVGAESTNNAAKSNFWIQDASYLRLKNAQIGYTLPKKWMDKVHIQNLRIYVTGENLFTFDHLPAGIDPENLSWTYPFSRTISFGINLNI